MAQVLKEEIRNKIHQMTIEEFYRHDYQSATLRNIACSAGIPVGLIYSYYKNKADLFDAIVRPVYTAVKNMLTVSEPPAASYDRQHNFHVQVEMPFLLHMLQSNRKQLIILIDKSQGTAYENTKEEFIQLTAEHIQTQLKNKLREELTIDHLFYHMLANNFVESLLEIARHYKNELWAEEMTRLFIQQYFCGVNSLMKNSEQVLL